MKKLLLLLLLASNSFSFRVGISDFEPMIIRNDSGYTGYDVELITKIIGDSVQLIYTDDFSSLFTQLEQKELDAAICGISVTEAREEKIDFSHSYFKSGLSILIHQKSLLARIQDWLVIRGRIVLALIPTFFIWALYISFGALIVWRFEKGNMDFDDNFVKGFPDARFFVHVVISSTGFGNQIPKSVWGRRITVLMMYSGIGFMFPMITGEISSKLTQYEKSHVVLSRQDLKNKRVGVEKNTTSVQPTKDLGARIIEIPSLDYGITLLKNNELDAIVSDLPALQYKAKHDNTLTLVNDVFEEQEYAIALQPNSVYRESINRTLLSLRESGFLDSLSSLFLN